MCPLDELEDELAMLEAEDIDAKLAGLDGLDVPDRQVAQPATATQEMDEDAELAALEAEMAM